MTMNELYTVLISLGAGALGYLIVTFWVQPVLRYRNIRYQIVSDLGFYRDVVNAEGLDASMKQRLDRRVENNRRSAADLTAIFIALPRLYKCWLCIQGIDVQQASSTLMGLSNTYDYDAAAERIKNIQRLLKITPPVVS